MTRAIRLLLPVVLVAALAACAAPPPTPGPTFDSAPTAAPTPEPTVLAPLDPCQLVTAADRIAVFGAELGAGTPTETDRSEMHQHWTSSGCTWAAAGVVLHVELAEANDFLNYEVVCLEPFESAVSQLGSVGDRAWTVRVETGTLVRGCTEGGIADVIVSGSSDPVGHAASVARVLLGAVA